MGLVLPGRPRVYRGITGLERDTPPRSSVGEEGARGQGWGDREPPWPVAAGCSDMTAGRSRGHAGGVRVEGNVGALPPVMGTKGWPGWHQVR